jgi:hypothetical protein
MSIHRKCGYAVKVKINEKHISGTRKNVGNPENLICDANCASPSNGLRRFIGTAGILIRKILV